MNTFFAQARLRHSSVRAVLCLLATTGVLLLSGCNLGLPQAQVDPTKTYVLSASAADQSTAPAGGVVLRLRPLEVPSYLRGQALAVRRGENELEFREFARWAEPLDQGIARVLREELLVRGANAVLTSGSRLGDAAEVKLELAVRVLACEGLADGNIAFRARWELVTATGAEFARGEYRASGLQWTKGNDATLAGALSRAVSGLAMEIGGKLPKP